MDGESKLAYLLNELVNVLVGVEGRTVNIILTPLCTIAGRHQLEREKYMILWDS